MMDPIAIDGSWFTAPRTRIWPLVKTALSFTLGCAACWLIAVFIGAFG